MLTSFFAKSGTINYLLLALSIPLVVIAKGFYLEGTNLKISSLLLGTLVALVIVLAFLLFDFILRKNKLTQANTYGALIFTCLVLTQPLIENLKVFLTLVVALLFYRRLYSLTNEVAIEKKIWDAGFWVFILALVYPWALLLLAPLAIAIGSLNQFSWRFAVAPLLAGIAVVLMTAAYSVLDPDASMSVALLALPSGTPLAFKWPQQTWLLALYVLGIVALLIGALHLPKARQDTSRASKIHLQWTLYILILGLVLMGLMPEAVYGVFLLLVAPQASIILVGLIERQRRMAIKELVLLALLILPLIEILLK